MRLACGNVWATVEEATAAEERWLAAYLSVPVAGREHSPAFRRRVWDGLTHLFKDGRFPVGLTRLVREAGGRAAPPIGPIEVLVADVRGAAPACAWGESRLGWLRDYQLEAARAGARRTRGIVDMPTGSGKTSVFVAWALGFPTLRWVVMVDTIDLVNQAAERFERYSGGERAGRVGGGAHRVDRFTVATLQTLHQSVASGDSQICRLVEDAQGMVVDECHILPADTYADVALRCGAYYRLGTSATPLMRGDARDFMTIGVLGPVVYRVDRAALVARGILASATIRFVELSHPRDDFETFAEAYEALVVGSAERNALVVEMTLALQGARLVFVRRQPHGVELARLLRAAGLRAEFVWGATSASARKAACERLQRRDIDVLVTSKIFNKGIDLPLVNGGVNAAGGKSESDALQKLGRLMRTSGGKTSFVYYDVLDRRNRWLRAQASARMKAYRDDGHVVEEITRADLVKFSSGA
jgi:superfamily II DNA or RNA helicase